jgi:hypothetical protein
VIRIARFSLRPGEKVRTPLIAVLSWQGDDVVRSQNLWRRWYRAHVLPKTDGVPQGPIKQIQVGGGSTEEVEQFVVAEIKPDVCWRDAGGSHTWYPSREGPYGPGGTATNPEFTTMGWLNTGNFWNITQNLLMWIPYCVLLPAFLRLPWLMVGVIARIHLQALRLWWKGAVFHRKPLPPVETTTR